MKAMLSYLVLNYDIKYPEGTFKHGELPPRNWFGMIAMPNNKAEILIRKRELNEIS
jgi:hypothetical protein